MQYLGKSVPRKSYLPKTFARNIESRHHIMTRVNYIIFCSTVWIKNKVVYYAVMLKKEQKANIFYQGFSNGSPQGGQGGSMGGGGMGDGGMGGGGMGDGGMGGGAMGGSGTGGGGMGGNGMGGGGGKGGGTIFCH
jgi:hypothetical protein